ncbi:hypothetical protein [Brevibacterium aurantiacum]|uniref:Uncharacterized protein n=1 Tax=Brevibacterium aurantiacum TaxID=273384 RepID=A0A2H1I7R1_BREAU|nr:hypothetical protein [Brevibacterium aurantiacum]MDN5588510.1 hypothetical protein [Brevibacterium sp.]AZL09010.1 hypothetical protein CXR26_07050 [Brevibacterium aurantiacum]AZT93096.1 hypothetical protein CXR23_08030 [Brevibacterium aurantiacum]TGD39431.1 hypothetical protein EB834_06715 [Brevibacterium aurantiacum]SMX71170.1 hypothetical protein BAURA63_00911 [Brevibacterium aurantiacum]
MSEDVQQPVDEATAASVESAATSAESAVTSAESAATSVEDRTQVRAHDGEPVSDDMASAAAVAAVVAIRQVALAYATNQAAALDLMETTKHGRAGFSAPRRNVRRRLPQAWTQTLGR